MRIERENAQPVIIGKRITIGAAINSAIAALVHFYPAHAEALVSLGVPVVFLLQVWIAHRGGVTS